MMSWHPARLLSSAALLPGIRVPNSRLGGDDGERVFKQTGIRARRYAAPHEAASDLGARVLRAAIAGVPDGVWAPSSPQSSWPATSPDACSPRERRRLEALVVATTSPDYPSPATAHYIHAQLKLAASTPAFDVASSCSSFLSALLAALPFAARGPTAVVATEVKHKALGDDPRMRALFADGAAAAILAPSVSEGFALAFAQVDSALAHHIQIPVGGSRTPATRDTVEGMRLRMLEPRMVYRHTVHSFCEAIEACWHARADVLRAHGLDPGLVPGVVYAHQANANILADVRERIGGDVALRLPILMEDVGNMVCASLPVARVRLEALARAAGAAVRADNEAMSLVDESGDAPFSDLTPGAREAAMAALRRGGLFDARPGLPRIDAWVAAGGGFQTLGVLHARGLDVTSSGGVSRGVMASGSPVHGSRE